MKPFLAAVRFLTIVPLPGTWGTAEADLARSVPYFPVVGLLLGGIAAGVAYGLSLVAPPLVTAAVLVLVLMAFSGCLHLDGLADTADGFFSSRSRDRILEIMKDSRSGAMGVTAIVSVLLVKFAALASLATPPGDVLWRAVLLMPLAGRCAMVLHIAILPYVRQAGLGTVFYQRRHGAAAVWAAAVFVVAAVAAAGWAGIVISMVWLAVTLLLAAYVYRKIGGATGDTLGAACEVMEIVPALALSIGPLAAMR